MPIKIPQPSMALASEHAYDYRGDLPGWIPGVTQAYRMWNTWTVGDDVPREHIADWVAAVADRAPDRYLRVVIITCHANPGSLRIGRPNGDADRNIEIPHLPLFAKWKNRVANIWIIACNVAYKMPDPKWDGNSFCSTFAKITGAYVVASSDSQMGDIAALPWGCVDDWEGLVRRYEPEHGSVDWHHDYGTGSLTYAGLASPDPVIPPIAVPPGIRDLMCGAASFWRDPRDNPGDLWRPSPRLRRGVPGGLR